jgi:hypothetical protein
VRSILDEDKTVATAVVARTVVGAWEQRLNRALIPTSNGTCDLLSPNDDGLTTNDQQVAPVR